LLVSVGLEVPEVPLVAVPGDDAVVGALEGVHRGALLRAQELEHLLSESGAVEEEAIVVPRHVGAAHRDVPGPELGEPGLDAIEHHLVGLRAVRPGGP